MHVDSSSFNKHCALCSSPSPTEDREGAGRVRQPLASRTRDPCVGHDFDLRVEMGLLRAFSRVTQRIYHESYAGAFKCLSFDIIQSTTVVNVIQQRTSVVYATANCVLFGDTGYIAPFDWSDLTVSAHGMAQQIYCILLKPRMYFQTYLSIRKTISKLLDNLCTASQMCAGSPSSAVQYTKRRATD